MKKLSTLFLSLCLIAFPIFAQTPITPAPAVTATCPAGNTPYNYFASASASYDYYAQTPAVGSGFGVKTGTCSNAFLVTTINQGVGPTAAGQTYATLSEKFEYHLAHSGNFEFIGDGQLGVAQVVSSSGTVTQAMFGGGVSVSYDVGYVLSKKAFHLPVVFHFDYFAITANQVKPTYTIDFRKTF